MLNKARQESDPAVRKSAYAEAIRTMTQERRNIIHRFAEKHNKLSLKVCVVEKEVYDGAKLKELAVMPSRSELLAAIVGSVQSPLAGVPMVINALLRDVVSLVDEIGKKKAA